MDTRQVFDELTDAVNHHDLERIGKVYSSTAVVSSPDGTFEGGAEATEYLTDFIAAFPDLRLDVWSKVTSGALVCDEWTFSGTHSGPLRLPDGDSIPATGRRVELRGCDVAAVEGDQVISHRIYFDQSDFLGQLGLAEVSS